MRTQKCTLSALTLTAAAATILALVLGSAMSVAAQQTSRAEVRQAAESVVQAHTKAMQAKDAAGVAALYSEDVIFVTDDGPLLGRAAVEKATASLLRVLTPEPAKLDQVVMIGDAVRLRTGTWSGVIQSPNGPLFM
jgi:uncharacterized protein (TIGR02246 family)